ncbi:MAG: AbgT family transporter [Lachnospiraceae bacterium]|nr:AbgT family transporter [Lachnospiraceae bacterium]
MAKENTQKKSFIDSFCGGIEKVANKLPSPFMIFVILFMVTAILSCILSLMGVQGIHPTTGEVVTVSNFFSRAGIVWLVKGMVTNMTGYAPFGLVLVMTIGIGMLEQTGMVNTLLRVAMAKVPPALVPFGCALIGICGNLFSDSCAVIIPPLAGLAFIGVGKHPIAGMLCGFLGTQGGFSANLIIAGTDGLLAGITNTVLDGFFGEGVYHVEVVCNWFFMIASTFMLSAVIAVCDQFILEPRFGKYVPGSGATGEVISMDTPSKEEVSALKASGLAAVAYVAVIILGLVTRVLTNEDGSILSSPFLSGIIVILFFLFFFTGLTYGIKMGVIKTERDISKLMQIQVKTMAPFIVTVFISAQFVNLFNWTKMGTLLSIAGANFLEMTGFTGMPMLVFFIFMVACINLLMGSSSAKWTILAPIFIPMMAMLGYEPAFIQVTYRIGDSCTNAMSPMSAYLIMILGIGQEKYDKNIEFGTLLSNLVPCCLVMLIVWSIFYVIYNTLGLPIGPGVGMYLPPEIAATIGL